MSVISVTSFALREPHRTPERGSRGIGLRRLIAADPVSCMTLGETRRAMAYRDLYTQPEVLRSICMEVLVVQAHEIVDQRSRHLVVLDGGGEALGKL